MIRAKLIFFLLTLASVTPVTAAEICEPAAADKMAGGDVRAITGIANPVFSIADRGAASFASAGDGTAIDVGQARVQPNSGSSSPASYLIFSFRQRGILVSQATVPAARPVSSGRIFAEVAGPVNTGLAFANPSDAPATISFFFPDKSGQDFVGGSFSLAANSQIARFLNQEPFSGSGGATTRITAIRGTLTFTSSVPVGVIALRGLTNERGEFLITTLPVAELGSTSTDAGFFPHSADGGGWTTQVVLVNPADTPISGTVEFIGGASQPYAVAPRSSQRIATSGGGSAIRVGAVRITPSAGSVTPSGLLIFTFVNAGVTVSEAGVPLLRPAQAFRMYEVKFGFYLCQP